MNNNWILVDKMHPALPQRAVLSIIFSEDNNLLVKSIPYHSVLHTYEVHKFFMYYYVENAETFLEAYPFTGVSIIYTDLKHEADSIVLLAVDRKSFDEVI